MKSLLDSFDNLLSQLPFDGNKTLIALAVHTAAPFIAPAFPPILAAGPVLDALSLLFAGIFATHKAIKTFNK